ncbi:MAG: cysteine peptidase family C39 domain-containing protein [Verrucomicrobiota bacterium]
MRSRKGLNLTRDSWRDGYYHPAFMRFQIIPAFLIAAMLASCDTISPRQSDRDFGARYSDFEYCKVRVVEQSSQSSCGAAALSSVLAYWAPETAPTERQILTNTPPDKETGYPILQLRDIARKQGMLAFAVSLDSDPMAQLTKHISAGRPVIVAASVPKGRYFATDVPLIETLDRRSIPSPVPGGDPWKIHYVVVCGISADEVMLMDPQYGIVTVPSVSFEQFWKAQKNSALICSKRPETT